jgi:hypothetical protein
MYYHVQTHKRVPKEEGSAFKQRVEQILNDKRGWDETFHRLQTTAEVLQKPKNKAFIIRLTDESYLNTLYPDFSSDQLSVANLTDRTIDINYCRWTERCPNKSQLPIENYQEYVILHEVGHILGKPHPKPSQLPNQRKAPIMMQQTLGILNYIPNSWPTKFDKNVL